MHCRSYSISVTLVVRSWFPVTKRTAFHCFLSRAALSFWWCRGPMHYRPTGVLASQESCTRSINSSSTYTIVRPCRCGVRCKKNNIFRGIKEFVWVVMMSSCSGTILSIFCDVREIQRRYCRLYLGIKIYRQSARIIFGAHVAHSLLWNTLTILHVPVFHLLNLNSSFLYPYKDSQTKPSRKANHIWLW